MKNEAKTVGSHPRFPHLPLSANECDIVELRLDGNYAKEDVDYFCQTCNHDILLTARDVQEGGIHELSLLERQKRLQEHLPNASHIDIEMRNWKAMTEVANQAKNCGIKTIASYHDFLKTPSLSEINEKITQYQNCGADILKFAFMTHGLEDVMTCQKVLFSNPDIKISIMGMGAYAPVARLLLAQSGSVLNYGYLGDTPTAPGQWPARLLKEAIRISERITQ